MGEVEKWRRALSAAFGGKKTLSPFPLFPVSPTLHHLERKIA
jgi:hypothetical protein